MIEAKKSRWFAAWFARHCEGRIRRSFDEVHVHGLDVLRATTTPVLIVSNHTAWWDPVVAIWLTQRLLRLDSYAMMNGANLRRLPFFAKIGAFGVDLEDPSDGARSLRYAARLLRDGRRTVWIFAQGDERPITEPLAFRPGSAELARLAPGCVVVPLALRYEMGNVERPRLYVSIGSPLPRTDRAGHEAAVGAELTRIDTWLRTARGAQFECIMHAQPSWWGAVAERMLSWFTRSALQPTLRPKRDRAAPPVQRSRHEHAEPRGPEQEIGQHEIDGEHP